MAMGLSFLHPRAKAISAWRAELILSGDRLRPLFCSAPLICWPTFAQIPWAENDGKDTLNLDCRIPMDRA